MKDTWQLADLWGNATVGTILDMKACYHNIPVEEGSQELLGMVMQDGTYVYTCMAFGVK